MGADTVAKAQVRRASRHVLVVTAWARWLIHFLQDVLIFSFMAAGSIQPRG